MTFEELNLIPQILKALHHKGYTDPTPIQERAIPVLLQGRDLLACAQTGTGKTAAFALPILQLLHKDQNQADQRRVIKALVLTPTRELAIQIQESFENYGKELKIRSTVIFGGVKQHSQVREIRAGVDVLIATPGRLLDLLNQKIVNLSTIQFFVLDEADRMLDMGFINDVKKIVQLIPVKRQTLFFSATMPPAIATLAHTILNQPIKVEVTPVSSTAATVRQSVYYVDKIKKKDLLLHLLKDEVKGSVLVFMRTKHGADKLSKFLNIEGVRSEAIHGNRSQGQRQTALTNFKEGKTRILVATDIAARGIDINALPYVINYDIPNEPETYVHRIGRTGRAGSDGTAISFADHEEKAYIKSIEKLINRSIPIIAAHAFPMTAYVPGVATPKSQPQQQQSRSFSRPRQATSHSSFSKNQRGGRHRP